MLNLNHLKNLYINAKYICSIEDFHKKNNYDNTGNYTPKEKKSYLLNKYRNLKKDK